MSKKLLPHDHGQAMEQELEHMPSVDNFQTVADIFKQLGDGVEAKDLYRIAEQVENALHKVREMTSRTADTVSDGAQAVENAAKEVQEAVQETAQPKAEDEEEA